jgi:SAM-dependent methyltransferase
MGLRVIGVDVSRQALARAVQCCREAFFVRIHGDGALPFPPSAFDAVVSTIALQHIQFFPVRHRYFLEFGRIVRLGGRLVIQLNADDSGKHIRWFERGTPDEYLAPDVVCDEAEICAYLEHLSWHVLKTERTPNDTEKVSWKRTITGRPDSWLWVVAERGRDA